MTQTVEWICFAIGGVLILTAVLTSIFKIKIGAVDVEGQSNWGQKIVAFVAGWVFVVIGGVFHGYGMYIAYGTTAATSEQRNFQPTNAATPDSSSAKLVSDPTPTPKPAISNVDISGLWEDQEGSRYQITQTGNALEVVGESANQMVVARGTGILSGRIVKIDISAQGVAGSCQMQVSGDARRMSGTYRVELGGQGDQPTTWNKIE